MVSNAMEFRSPTLIFTLAIAVLAIGMRSDAQTYNDPTLSVPQSEIDDLATASSPESISDLAENLGSLESFEQFAMANHPTLSIAIARILATQHEAIQAGLAPNPQLGIFLDELGNEDDPGIWGAYFQRDIIRGNKRGLSRQIKNQEALVLEFEFNKQVLKIRTDVRTAFYKLLLAQQKHILTTQLYETQQDAITKSKQLFESGESPKTDLLQSEFQARQTQLLMGQAKITQKIAWRELSAVVGTHAIPIQHVTGTLAPDTEESLTFEFCLNLKLHSGEKMI